MRLTMINIVDASLLAYPEVVATLFVEDLAVERDSNEEEIIAGHCGFTKMV